MSRSEDSDDIVLDVEDAPIGLQQVYEALIHGKERVVDIFLQSLDLKNNSDNTALHVAAQHDNVEAAQLLVNKNHELLNICNERGILPIHLAALTAHRETTSYLFSVGLKDEIHSSLLKNIAGGELMLYLVNARFYDLALQLLDHNQDEEVAFNDLKSPLSLLASDPSVFPSRTHYSVPMVFIQEEMMTKSPNSTLPRPHKDQACQEILVILWKVLQVVVPPMKRISNEKLRHHQAIQLVKHFCSIMARKSTQPSEIVEPFLFGAGNGIEEIVTEILDSFPVVIGMKDRKKEYSVFHYALMYRHEKIFKILLQHQKNNIDHSTDSNGNNILHLAGYRARQDRRLDLGPGPILQMQRELQWFMEIEKLVTRQESLALNSDDKTPLMIFNEEHADLASMEIQWVTRMASACSVVASLIATVAFAAAITVPGGNNSNGLPFFSSESSFLVFAVSDALALFTSLTCVLCFLSIFTCRYGVKDFLYTLPNRVIYGLICLILSVISLMIAFSSTLFLVFAKKNPLILIPIVALTCVPVISYTFIQLPPLLDMINSTFGPGLFEKEFFRVCTLTAYKDWSQKKFPLMQEVEKFVLPQERKSKIISMSTSCTVAASLIANVAFAAAITVPGGNNSNGLPIFSNRKSFIVFAISDALALLSSITTVYRSYPFSPPAMQ
ncbi:Ankyrin repeat family protein [Abeliophyllum distichum]|uniref:Ankyrin repeat family protein n=1 Tax=Abeliophyllum distichum TaxID=126358 RepID=A0ABD1V7C7_9LAMI